MNNNTKNKVENTIENEIIDKEKKKLQRKEINRRYREKHKEDVNNYNTKYREEHKDSVQKYNNTYYSKVQNNRNILNDLLQFIQQENVINLLHKENISIPDSVKDKLKL
jgi:hypothetical protein